MARYRVLIKPSAVREIEAIPQKRQRQRLVARGVDPAAVQAHLEDLRENVLLVAPGAGVERLEVYRA